MDAVSIIPIEDAAAADDAFPGEKAHERKQVVLQPAPAIKAAKSARATVFAEFLSQNKVLLVLARMTAVCDFRAHATWRSVEGTGFMGVRTRLALVQEDDTKGFSRNGTGRDIPREESTVTKGVNRHPTLGQRRIPHG